MCRSIPRPLAWRRFTWENAELDTVGQCSVTQARTELAGLIEGAFSQWQHRCDHTTWLLTCPTVTIPSLNVYDWMALQPAGTQLLWQGRDDDLLMAGIGKADVVAGGAGDTYDHLLERCRRYISGAEDVRYYGGFAFQPSSVDDDRWCRFGPSRFILPRFEVRQQAGATVLRCNLLFRHDHPLDQAQITSELMALRFPTRPADRSLPPILDRTDYPDEMAWSGNVLAALELINNQVLEKIVLARRADYRFAESVSSARILARLHPVTSDCFHFHFQPDEHVAFMGTTPERLFKRSGRKIWSEVLAGTRPRSVDPLEDQAFSDDLLNSAKEQREHHIVRKSIRQKLHMLCEELDVEEEAALLKLERKQHLRSRVEGRLSPSTTDADLLRQLHPTPAVGGYPRENALAEIPALEPFCRGWYAAPIGWVSAEEAEFAVAIRSGLVQGDTVSVYSGAGIVAGSVPEEEWQEIENKISDFVKVTSAV
ncbi:MAG: menaquinone-specific isochorismate synthase [Candidatus Omnitrophota bacterium]|jgi:menaquinone-specific isochorismate synthase